jgi:hypothetical protein
MAAKIIGRWASVCVVLRDNYPIRPADEMNEEFKKIMKRSDIFSIVQLANRATIKMGRPNQS